MHNVSFESDTEKKLCGEAAVAIGLYNTLQSFHRFKAIYLASEQLSNMKKSHVVVLVALVYHFLRTVTL